MLIEHHVNQYRTLNEWFQSPLGLSVALEFTNALEPVTNYLKGDILLQLGHCGDNPWLNNMNFSHKWVASPVSVENSHRVESALNQLPFPRNSLDCVLAPLSLEPFGSSLTLLDEIDRVLKPMGHVIILSINPWSLWGVAAKCGLLHCYNVRKIQLRTAFNLNRTFLQRGYTQSALGHFGYFPPSNKKVWRSKFAFFDEYEG